MNAHIRKVSNLLRTTPWYLKRMKHHLVLKLCNLFSSSSYGSRSYFDSRSRRGGGRKCSNQSNSLWINSKFNFFINNCLLIDVHYSRINLDGSDVNELWALGFIIENEHPCSDNLPNVGTINCAAEAVGDWIAPTICPYVQENCCNINGNFSLISWKIVVKTDELDFLKVSFNQFKSFFLMKLALLPSLLFKGCYNSMNKFKFSKHKQPKTGNIRSQNFYILVLHFPYCLLWGYLGQKILGPSSPIERYQGSPDWQNEYMSGCQIDEIIQALHFID